MDVVLNNRLKNVCNITATLDVSVGFHAPRFSKQFNLFAGCVLSENMTCSTKTAYFRYPPIILSTPRKCAPNFLRLNLVAFAMLGAQFPVRNY